MWFQWGRHVARHKNMSHMGCIFVLGWMGWGRKHTELPMHPNGHIDILVGGVGWWRTSQTQKTRQWGMFFHVWWKWEGRTCKTHPPGHVLCIWQVGSCVVVFCWGDTARHKHASHIGHVFVSDWSGGLPNTTNVPKWAHWWYSDGTG